MAKRRRRRKKPLWRTRQGRRFLLTVLLLISLIVVVAVWVAKSCNRTTTAVVPPEAEQTTAASVVSSEAEQTTVTSVETTTTAVTAPSNVSLQEGWELRLVNSDHAIPEDYVVPLAAWNETQSVDRRIYPALVDMMADAFEQTGIEPTITSSYRTAAKQQSLMDERIAEYVAAGYSEEEAAEEASLWVNAVGTSEHQIGLCVDISALSEDNEDCWTLWGWLIEHCSDYGFILRYPDDKEDITGIDYEPWHYRYVGDEAAAITESGLCLEEYLEAYGR